jgi:hypothetical protein
VSLYTLQKLIRDVNRDDAMRASYFASPEAFADGYELTAEERDALLKVDLTRLYGFGVHGLLLKPFSILHKVSEPDYLTQIRKSA